MGYLKALTNSVGGALADQWLDIITAGGFDEHTVVSPGVMKNTNNGRGANLHGSDGVISTGSKIYIPENTAAFVFSESGIEEIITEPGAYEYMNGEDSVFSSGSAGTLIEQIGNRFSYGGISDRETKIAYVNLREIRGIKFGTRGPQAYHDMFYGVDLEITAYGSFSIKVVEPQLFVRNFVPANVTYYTLDDPRARAQVIAEFLQSFSVALNIMSNKYRMAELPAHMNEIAEIIASDKNNAGSWPARFGFCITKAAIENVEYSDESRILINKFAANRMDVKAYENISQRASNMAAQQKIAQGVQKNGLGSGAGVILGMGMAQTIGKNSIVQPAQSEQSFDQQVEMMKKLKELLDAGILTQEEFDLKKKELMGL